MILGNSLVVQWLGFRAPIAGGMGLIPGLETKIPHAIWRGQKKKNNKKNKIGTSLVAQWLRILLPMQGTWVRALVGEDPTCR